MEWLADSEAIDAPALQPMVAERVEKSVLVPLFEKARARPDTTAWVAFNDNLGSWAIDWLRARGVSVPDELSVVGFDESPRSLEYDMTSYSFGGRAALRAAVTFLLLPAPARRLGPLYEAPGRVVPRGTTAIV